MKNLKNFLWGVATSAYQIEGARGKRDSVWDMFCKIKGKIWNEHSGDIACDHYKYYKEDIALMDKIGVGAYHFSVDWSRIFPGRDGVINQEGLDFYDRLIDEMLKYDIEPFLNIYHWEMPYELFCKGGWLNNDSPDWFSEYTKVLVDKFSDRVKHWLTVCEPQCAIGEGYYRGEKAPGLKLGLKEVFRAGHNLLLAHGKAVQAIRTYSRSESKVGYSPVGITKMPVSNDSKDIEAAREMTFSRMFACWNNTWWIDPVILGEYPRESWNHFLPYVPEVKDGDMEIISQPLDFLGLDIYSGDYVRMGENGCPEELPSPPGAPLTAFRWKIEPESLYWGPRFFYERYKLPIFITENGMSCFDFVSLDGRVHDLQRIDFMKRYLSQLKKAVSDNVDVRGYFHWSMLDNFEWQDGYKERFGLTYVNFETQERILKDSAYWYKALIESGGESL